MQASLPQFLLSFASEHLQMEAAKSTELDIWCCMQEAGITEGWTLQIYYDCASKAPVTFFY